MTYRSVLYLKSKLKTFPFDNVMSVFWLQSISNEIGSNEVVSILLCKFYECRKLQNLKFFEKSVFLVFNHISGHILPTGVNYTSNQS